MIDYGAVITLIGFVVAAVAMVFVLPILKEKLGAEQLKAIWKAVCIGVQAAEQIFGSGKGAQKKGYAYDYLDSVGITKKITPEELDALIEAAVFELT